MKKIFILIIILIVIVLLCWSCTKSPWAFFTQEVADTLEPPVDQPIETYNKEEIEKIEEWLPENLIIDENGFVHPKIMEGLMTD